MIIGLAGKARSGKSTIARYLAMQYNFIELSFAEPLKDMVKVLLSHIYPEDELEGKYKLLENDKTQEIELLHQTYRFLLQTLGTEWGREIVYKDIWSSILEKKLQQNRVNVVISDLRFNNEADLIVEYGGKIILIERDSIEVSEHKSETETIRPHYLIKNNSDFRHLFYQVEDILRDIKYGSYPDHLSRL